MATVTADLIDLYVESDTIGLAGLIRRGTISPSEAVETAITVIELLDPKLNAVVIRTFELAREAATQSSESAPFVGVPFLLKNIGSMCRGVPLTAGYSYLKDFACSYDSEMVTRIKRAGFAVLGRSNVPEGGWSIGTEPRLYGPTLNPWNPTVTPGGSSGGAAAAVAARMTPLAEASDGAGSIRAPASCCGLVGLKPSRGRITYGPSDVDLWFGSVSTFCLTRTIRDSAAFLDIVAGGMSGDPYTPQRPDKSWLSTLDDRPRKLRIGFDLTPNWGAPLAPDVADAVASTAALLGDLGHEVEAYSLKTNIEAAWWSYNDICATEMAAEFDQLRLIVGRPVEQTDLAPFNWSQLQYGRELSAVRYAHSITAIRKAGQQICQELDRYDVFLTPTLTQPARPLGYWSMEDGDRERYLARWGDGAFLFAFNIAGLPAMSVPAIHGSNGVPVGVQIVARYGDEATLLRLGRDLEQARPWNQRRPAMSADILRDASATSRAPDSK
jgi:amidase